MTKPAKNQIDGTMPAVITFLFQCFAAALVTMFYVMIWALCLVSRIVAARLIQQKIRLEQLALLDENHCLGERMAFWQQQWSPEFGGTK